MTYTQCKRVHVVYFVVTLLRDSKNRFSVWFWMCILWNHGFGLSVTGKRFTGSPHLILLGEYEWCDSYTCSVISTEDTIHYFFKVTSDQMEDFKSRVCVKIILSSIRFHTYYRCETASSSSSGIRVLKNPCFRSYINPYILLSITCPLTTFCYVSVLDRKNKIHYTYQGPYCDPVSLCNIINYCTIDRNEWETTWSKSP